MPTTIEFARVVVSGGLWVRPMRAAPLAVAPIAPDPFVPVVSIPLNDSTLMKCRDALRERGGERSRSSRLPGANARQISAVPFCVFVRLTRTQVRPPPVTFVTVVAAALTLSAATSASSSSFVAVVENEGDTTVVAEFDRPSATFTSRAGIDAFAVAVKLTAVTFAPAIVTERFSGDMVAPPFVGVTVYGPLVRVVNVSLPFVSVVVDAVLVPVNATVAPARAGPGVTLPDRLNV